MVYKRNILWCTPKCALVHTLVVLAIAGNAIGDNRSKGSVIMLGAAAKDIVQLETQQPPRIINSMPPRIETAPSSNADHPVVQTDDLDTDGWHDEDGDAEALLVPQDDVLQALPAAQPFQATLAADTVFPRQSDHSAIMLAAANQGTGAAVQVPNSMKDTASAKAAQAPAGTSTSGVAVVASTKSTRPVRQGSSREARPSNRKRVFRVGSRRSGGV